MTFSDSRDTKVYETYNTGSNENFGNWKHCPVQMKMHLA